MKTELQNSFGNIFLSTEYDARNNWVYNNWIGYQTLESIMAGANKCLELLEHYKSAHLLNDNRLVLGPWDHATDWIAQDWAPRAIAIGLTHFANVVSPESFARASAETMNTKISGFFNMQIFGEFEDAKRWLSQH